MEWPTSTEEEETREEKLSGECEEWDEDSDEDSDESSEESGRDD